MGVSRTQKRASPELMARNWSQFPKAREKLASAFNMEAEFSQSLPISGNHRFSVYWCFQNFRICLIQGQITGINVEIISWKLISNSIEGQNWQILWPGTLNPETNNIKQKEQMLGPAYPIILPYYFVFLLIYRL